MHELGIVVHLIDRVERIAEENKVNKVDKIVLEIGQVSGIVEEYFTDAFAWAKKKTKYLKDCRLEIIIIAGISYCRNCKSTYSTTEYAKICPNCKSDDTYLLTGDEITIKDIEVE